MTTIIEANEPIPTPTPPAAVLPPTPAEIDDLLEEYDQAMRMLKAARETVETHKAMLIFHADTWGTVPAHAEQSRRLEGKLHTLTITRGTSITVDEPAVLDLEVTLSQAGMSELFYRLFSRSTKHKMVEGANEVLRTVALPQRLHQKVLALFGQCITVETNSPSVKVEMRKAEKPAKAKKTKKGGAA